MPLFKLLQLLLLLAQLPLRPLVLLAVRQMDRRADSVGHEGGLMGFAHCR